MSIQDTLPIDFSASAHAHRFDTVRHLQEHEVLGVNASIAGLYAKVNLLNFDENGNLIANVTLRTGTFASLMSLAGSLGEIGVCTDVEAFVVFNGVAGQAKAYYRNRQVAHTLLLITTVTVPNGAGDTRLVFNTSTKTGTTFTVAGGYGSLPTIVPSNIGLRGDLRLAYNASITSITLSIFSEDAVGAGTYSVADEITYPVFMVSGVGAVIPFSFLVDPAITFTDSSPGVRWYLAARHNGSSSVSVSMHSRDLTYEVMSA